MSEAGKNLSKDPWSSCGSCRFWKSAEEIQGLCLRHAPPPLIDTEPIGSTLLARWAVTHHSDVCGEYAAESDK
jgi:hypothetical protein